ncbi:MAG: hypothetical protein LUE92_01095 [Clostridiales bacterium]|nr:hypothetical protein [Clostridiales bacterium]
MTDMMQKAAVKVSAAQWAGHGDEKQWPQACDGIASLAGKWYHGTSFKY